MPVASRPAGKPRGRPFLRSVPGEWERAELFVERAAHAHCVKAFRVRSVRSGGMATRAARNMVARALRVELGWTLQEIAEYLGWSNHSSVRSAVVSVSTLLMKAGDDAERYAKIIAP